MSSAEATNTPHDDQFRNPAQMRALLREEVAALLGVPAAQIAEDRALRELGIDSPGVVALAVALSKRLGREVPQQWLWQHGSLRALAAHLVEGGGLRWASGSVQEGLEDEPIAVVGMGCRLPGSIADPARLWDALLEGVDAVVEVPADRWNADDWFDPDLDEPGKMSTRWGGFLDDVAGFDAGFFRISPVEARQMDPQQRLALEVSYAALEDARIDPSSLARTRTGVFFGEMWQEYQQLTGGDATAIEGHSAVGWDNSIIPARIAYFLGLNGPVMAVATACSSSLVAVHLAMQSLRRRESDLVLAGGVSLMLSPHVTVAMTKFGAMSPTGQCRAFDAGANGYVRGEGCGVLVLRRLSEAVAAGDRIYAVLRGSAVNGDGASNGLTAPSQAAQAAVVREAWAAAKIPTTEVGYVETHGTGTPLGDPIEASALASVFAADRSEPLEIGSVKTNFGHLEPAAGVVGLMKAALMLHHGELPPSLHFDAPNPHIDFEAGRLDVVTARRSWPGARRFAGVSSFGFGGTNAHVALESPPYRPSTIQGSLSSDATTGEHPRLVWFFSGHGAQWPGMARDLLSGEPEFRAGIMACDAVIRELAGWSVLERLASEPTGEPTTDVVQPLLFSIQVALARMLRSWGLEPDAVIGQSVGEVAAAVVGGALPLVEGARVITTWSALVDERASGRGGMRMCALDWRRAREALVGHPEVCLAGDVAPEHVCVAGPLPALDRWCAELEARGVRTQRIRIDYACHSETMAPLMPELVARLGEVARGALRVPMGSTVLGRLVDGEELDSAYWATNMREPMALVDTVVALTQGGAHVIELGPHPVARKGIEATLAARGAGGRVYATLERGRAGRECLDALAESLARQGFSLDAAAVRGERRGIRLSPRSPFVVSGKSERALRRNASNLAAHLAAHPEQEPADVAFSLATTRQHHEYRASVSSEDPQATAEALVRLAEGKPDPRVLFARSVLGGETAVMFTGQGSQRAGMGRDLMETLPGFATTLAEIFDAVDSQLPRPLREVMFAHEGTSEAELLHQTAFAQPALFALEVALFRQWERWGVAPLYVVGHSVGELAAAHVAGVLSLEDAARLVCARGRLMQSCRAGGSMASIEATKAEVVARLGPGVEVAGVNAPRQTVISGDAGAVLGLVERFRGEGRRARVLEVSHAFHSAHMDEILAEYREVAEACAFGAPRCSIVSTVTGALAGAELCTPDYWVRQIREPVRFMDAMLTLRLAGVTRMLECGPGGVLCAMGAACLEHDDAPYHFVPSLSGVHPERVELERALGALHCAGGEIDWRAVFRGSGAQRVGLPGYAFEHQPYWLQAPRRVGSTPSTGHELLWDAVAEGEAEAVARVLSVPEEELEPVRRLLPYLSQFQHQRAVTSRIESWLYEDRWIRLDATGGRPFGGRWVVVEPRGLERAGLVEALVGAGADTVERVGAGASREQLATVLAGWGEIHGVIDLSLLDARLRDREHGAIEGVSGVLGLVQALGDAGLHAPLWCLTTGGVVVEADDEAPWLGAGAMRGLGRVLDHEATERWGGTIDVGPELDAATIPAILAAIAAHDREDQVAVRPRGRWVRRLERSSTSEVVARYEATGTALVTGGSGALAAHVAHWLADRGVQRLVLVSRRGPEAPGASSLVEALRAKGVEVELAACDVSDREQLAALLEPYLDDEVMPLRSVFHVAGVLDDRRLSELDAASMARVAAPKLDAAWHLHELLADHPLTAFVMFSSVVGRFGNPGQGNYAAANAGLDALAAHRRARGLPGVAIAWGPWAGEGMARGSAEQQLRSLGLVPMPPPWALEGLERAVVLGRDLVVADIAWERFARSLDGRPLIASIPQAQASLEAGAQATDEGARSLRAALLALPERGRQAFLVRSLAEEAAAILGFDDASQLDPERAFGELGFDSMMALSFSRRVQDRTGITTPRTLVYDQPNLLSAARWLLERLVPTQDAAVASERREVEKGPLAVVGVGLRFPGGAHDLEGLWQVLAEGQDTRRTVGADRFDVEGLYDHDWDAPGKVYVREAALLDDIAGFDAAFFGISPREAEPMDPQHRLLLETTWHALENAGLRPETLEGVATGVFVGAAPGEYGRYRGQGVPDAYTLTGSLPSFSAGRLSYHLRLHGPSVAVDTACSSSLVALHLACESLRRGESDVALAAGVQVIADPSFLITLCRSHALAPDGLSKTFSAKANGYGRGEGVGVLVVMRLQDALDRGSRVLGVIRGSAINHDGASSGITAPNGSSQQEVLRAALVNSGLSAGEVDYVECHGTGTSLGDPIEVQALAAVYGGTRAGPLMVGAAKSTLGHLESAAGIVGVCKVLASFRHAALPPTLHTRPRNPLIPWEALPLEVVDALRPWPRGGSVRRAGVSSFGMSGTNSHVILEEPPVVVEPAVAQESGLWLVPLSGRDPDALREQASRWAEWLARAPGQDLRALAITASCHRTHFGARAAVVARDVEQLERGLKALAQDGSDPALTVGRVRSGSLAVLFSGQGSQRLGMGARLRAVFPVFRESFDAVVRALEPHLERSLASVLFTDPSTVDASLIDRTAWAQPALFALEVALYRQYEHWGITPQLVAGHSVGELAAAHVAGVLELDDAARLVCARGRLMQGCVSGGAMISIEATELEVCDAIGGSVVVDIAGLNEPRQVVVSGDEAAVLSLAAGFEARGRRVRRLTVSHAFHSAHMDEMLDALGGVAASCRFAAPRIPLVSTVTGALCEAVATPGYWVQQARRAVRFVDAMQTLHRAGVTRFLECGPSGVLSAMGQQCLPSDAAVLVASQRQGYEEPEALMLALGRLHVSGEELDWHRVVEGHAALVELPGYPFQRRRFWLDVAASGGAWESIGIGKHEHPWLGGRTRLAKDGGMLLTGRIAPRENRWLEDHRIFDQVLVPGTGMLELALEAAGASGARTVTELTLSEPMRLGARGLRLQVVLEAVEGSDDHEVLLFSQTDAESTWTRHASGRVSVVAPAYDDRFMTLESWPPEGETVVLDGFYARLESLGLGYGRSFQGLVELYLAGDRRAYGRVRVPEDAGARVEGFGMHPALLDSALHAMLALVEPEPGKAWLPFSWSNVVLHATGSRELRVCVEIEARSADTVTISMLVADLAGLPVMQIGALQLRQASAQVLRAATRVGVEHLYELGLEPVEASEPTGAFDGVDAAVLGEGPLASVLGVRVLSETLESAVEAPPRVLVVDATTVDASAPSTAALAATTRALELLQQIAGDERWHATALVFVTRGAQWLGEDAWPVDVAHAPLLGLLRCARLEHRELTLRSIDVDVLERGPLVAALALHEEAELVVRGGAIGRVRLHKVSAIETRVVEPAMDPEGTVLVTGGVGELGRRVAHALVVDHGIRHLLLTSRRGPAGPGVEALVAALREAGAVSVEVRACNVGVRDELVEVLDAIDPLHPLTGVFHLAGVLDDGLVRGQTAERLAAVFEPKVQGAVCLHELTRSAPLRAFVMFSSAAGSLGIAGQGIYGAANVFLDALAVDRQRQGLPAKSVAWGLWRPSGEGMTAHLGAVELSRMRRQGVLPLEASEGLQLLGVALARHEPVLVPVSLALDALADQVDEGGEIPAALRGLLRPRLRRAASGGAKSAVRERLARLDDAARREALVDIVRAAVTSLLRLEAPAARDRVLREQGMDSLMAVELRDRLGAELGVSLSATMAYDYPTPVAIAELLLEKLAFDAKAVVAPRARTERVDEPIAIVSIACRLAGGVESPEEYWDLLAAARDAVEPFPSRWSALDVFDPTPGVPGKSYANEGGFLRAIDQFDAGFFGVTPREAESMDPQQRLVLELTWEALERAGIAPHTVSGSQTGVYLGTMGSDYDLERRADMSALDGYQGTGNASSVLSGRVAYSLGMHGPAMTIDTACSSSLVALHVACNALRNGECDMAIAGGVSLMSTPSLFVEFSRLQGLAADGRCKSFSAQADGTGWAEGCGLLVLERESVARRTGHPIVALIRGSAINQDGRSQGLSAPNGPAQQRVILEALAAAGLEPNDIDAVEAHGTGTRLGDPIEAGALAEVFGPSRSPERPLYLGSSKSNLGHSQAAAGVAGVIKMALALHNELLPQTLHAEEPSPHIAWSESGLALLQLARPWPRQAGTPRRAGISSFGIGGTNAHVVLEEAPASGLPVVLEPSPAGALPLVLSGRSDEALRAQAQRWAAWLAVRKGLALHDVVRTAAWRRSHLERRAALLVEDLDAAGEALEALGTGREHPAVVSGRAAPRGKLAFVFPGQGSQWKGMGQALLRECAPFREALERCDEALEPLTGWSVRSVLADPDGARPFERVDVVQPTLFAMAIALAEAWRAFGIEPAAVIGHSQGEVPAAVVAGALSLEDGARIVTLRSRAVLESHTRGAMVLIERPLAEVEAMLERYGGALSVAVVNSATSTVVSGDVEAAEALLEELARHDLFFRRVNVDYASHCRHMDALLPGLRTGLAGLRPRAAAIPFYSTVTGGRLEGEALDGEYWTRNLREPVRLDLALAQLVADGHDVFVECSAHPLLSMTLTGEVEGALVVGSLKRDSGGHEALLRGLMTLFTHGLEIDWSRVLGDERGPVVSLPSYAFQRERFWPEAKGRRGDVQSMGLEPAPHPWLGAAMELAHSSGTTVFCARLSRKDHLWLDDHRVHDTVLVPGAGIVDLVLAAGHAVDAPYLADLTLAAPIVLTEALRLQLSVSPPDAAGDRPFVLHGRRAEGGDAWIEHCTGTLRTSPPATSPGPAMASAWPAPGSEPVAIDDLYSTLKALGLGYGPAFQGLVELWRGTGGVAFGRVVLPEALRGGGFGLHPALLDAALHTSFAALAEPAREGRVLIPFAWSDVALHVTGGHELRVVVQVEEEDEQARAHVSITTPSGGRVFEGTLELRRLGAAQLRAMTRSEHHHLYRVQFQPVGLPAPRPTRGVLVLGAIHGVAEPLGSPAVEPSGLVEYLDHERTEPPRVVVVDATGSITGDPSVDARSETERALAVLNAALAEPRLDGATLVWLTRGAIAVDDAPVDLARAPLWGLLRTARREAGREIRAIDLDPGQDDWALLTRALQHEGEPELALRGGEARAARLVRAAADAPVAAPSLAPGTTLITGGMGELGSALALHLVEHHGVRHLVLTSRQGPASDRAQALCDVLWSAGAETVHVVPCDVTRRESVEAVVGGIGSAQPLRAVFHLAGVLDDATLANLDAERLWRVLAPKVAGAWNLHRATEALELDAFVLYSSAGGVLGAAGQANYAAANTFLDALAARRRGWGLPATSLAWGLWAQDGTGMTGHLGRADLARVRRMGVEPLSVSEGLALLDVALGHAEPALVPVRLALQALEAQAEREGEVAAMMRALVRPLRRRASEPASGTSLRERLAARSAEERVDVVVDVITAEVAVVVGLADATSIEPDKVLAELGLDSLMAVELRKRLAFVTGVSLPATLVFDYPTPVAIARMLLEHLDLDATLPTSSTDEVGALDHVARLRWALARITPEELHRQGLLQLLVDAAGGERDPAGSHESSRHEPVRPEDIDAELHALLEMDT